MARVFVIVTCYRHARFLPATVASLTAQRLADWQGVIVDDGSPDESLAVARALAAAEPRLSVIAKANGGVGDARNAGFAACPPEAEYVCVLDGDDAWEPAFLEAMVRRLDDTPAAVAATCAFRVIDEAGRDQGIARRSRIVPGPLGWPRDLRDRAVDTPFVAFYCATGQGPFALFRRAAYEATQGWVRDFSPHEDTDFLCQIALRGRVCFEPRALYLKRHHVRQVTRDGEARLPHLPADAYHRFRRRWCLWPAADAREEALLAAAHRYYMRWFRPLRDLKVAGRALRAFLRGGEARHLRWSGFLLRRAAADLVRYHVLRRRPDRARDLARFPLDAGSAA
jgi:glycosyltransferase involved in cell wall biosynthesis